MTAQAIQGFVWEDGAAVALARVYGADGALITQATVSSITYATFDMSNGAAAGPTGTPVVASTIFDTIQGANLSDVRWTADNIGFNFRYVLPAATFPVGQHRYRIEFKLTMASGDILWIPYEAVAKAMLTS